MSFGGEFNTSNLESGVMLFSMDFGGPLEGFATVDEGENGSFFDPPGPQSTVFGEWASAAYEVLDAYGAEGEGDIEVVYFWGIALPDITLNLLIHDVILVTGSVAFIFFYMWFHTQSCCLSGMGLLHIFASLPIAFLIYYYGFGIEPFYTLNFLSVYVRTLGLSCLMRGALQDDMPNDCLCVCMYVCHAVRRYVGFFLGTSFSQSVPTTCSSWWTPGNKWGTSPRPSAWRKPFNARARRC